MAEDSDNFMMTRTLNLEGGMGGTPSHAPRQRTEQQFGHQEPQRPAPVASGGWGFDGDGTQPKIQIPIQEKHYKDDDDEVIPLIPDLEEEADEDITRQVAAPPVVAQFQPQKVPNLKDLDNELYGTGGKGEQRQVAGAGLTSTPEEGVDLSILLQALCPQKNLIEDDVVWDHDQLFHEVASYVTKEQEAADVETDNSPVTTAVM